LAASLPKSQICAYRLKSYSWWVTVFVLQHPGRFPRQRWKTVAIRMSGLGFEIAVWFNPTGARKALEILG
jgi:hypothetical protein